MYENLHTHTHTLSNFVKGEEGSHLEFRDSGLPHIKMRRIQDMACVCVCVCVCVYTHMYTPPPEFECLWTSVYDDEMALTYDSNFGKLHVFAIFLIP